MFADDAAADLMKHLDWQPPAIVQRVAGTQGRIEEMRRDLTDQVIAGERSFDEWKAGGALLRESMWFAFTSSLEVDTVPNLTMMIAMVEERQEEAAKRVAQQRKHALRTLKVTSEVAPTAVPVFEPIYNRAFALAESEVREKLDFALFLRALRSEVRQLKAGGRKIVKVDVDAYLRSLHAG